MAAPRSKCCSLSFSRWVALLICIFLAADRSASPQLVPARPTAAEPRQSIASDPQERPSIVRAVSFLSPLKPQTLAQTYHPITPTQSVNWFITSTVGPPDLGGAAFLSACRTALNHPEAYGSHWRGFGKRFGAGMAGSALGTAIEGSVGLVLGEDPRCSRVPREPFKARVVTVISQTFSARQRDGSFEPAYARYAGIVGSNFISNSWRAGSEANVQSALLRSLEGFGGRMAADAFNEFWPDVKRYVARKHVSRVRQGLDDAR